MNTGAWGGTYQQKYHIAAGVAYLIKWNMRFWDIVGCPWKTFRRISRAWRVCLRQKIPRHERSLICCKMIELKDYSQGGEAPQPARHGRAFVLYGSGCAKSYILKLHRGHSCCLFPVGERRGLLHSPRFSSENLIFKVVAIVWSTLNKQTVFAVTHIWSGVNTSCWVRFATQLVYLGTRSFRGGEYFSNAKKPYLGNWVDIIPTLLVPRFDGWRWNRAALVEAYHLFSPQWVLLLGDHCRYLGYSA